MRQTHDTIFSKICRATPVEAIQLVADMKEEERASIALACNARAHLRAAGRAIASTCSSNALIREAGESGRILHAQSTMKLDTWVARMP